jgi:hypothetical protein
MDALAGDPRANAYYMEQHKRGPGLARSRMCFCARIQLRCERVDFICKSFMHYDLSSRHVCSLSGVAVQLLSQSPHLYAKVELHPLAQIIVKPSTSPFESLLSREFPWVL